MSEIIPELKLTYLEGSNPKHYGLNVKMENPEFSSHLMLTHNGSLEDSNLKYVLTVVLEESEEGTNEFDIDLGQLNLNQDEGQIDVSLMVSSTEVGTGTIRAEEAQQETRPLDFND
jgi:hypothetical protein